MQYTIVIVCTCTRILRGQSIAASSSQQTDRRTDGQLIATAAASTEALSLSTLPLSSTDSRRRSRMTSFLPLYSPSDENTGLENDGHHQVLTINASATFMLRVLRIAFRPGAALKLESHRTSFLVASLRGCHEDATRKLAPWNFSFSGICVCRASCCVIFDATRRSVPQYTTSCGAD